MQVSNRNHYYIAALAAFLLPFFVYLYFLCPTIAAGDSGELITGARILGIPHPPGYPLYTMIGHLFTYLPMNSVAWRVNLSSAVLCALTCLLVYLSIFKLTSRIWPALAAAWGLAFSRFFWQYAEVAEVFPLNNFFTALLTYLLILIAQNYKQGTDEKIRSTLSAITQKRVWLFSFLFGLALTNHHTIILLGPAAVFVLWQTAPAFFKDRKTFVVAALFFMFGLTPYLYCPLAAMNAPAINWDNPVTLENFWRLITRADYGGFSPFASQSPVPRISQLPTFFAGLYQQFTALGIALALLGLVNFKRHKLFQGYLALAFFFSGIFFVMYANVPINNPLLLGVLHRFYIMPAVIVSFWIGLGVEDLLRWIERRKWPKIVVNISPAFLILPLLVWEFAANIEEANFRENTIAEDFGRDVLLSLPPNALFFVSGDVASMAVDYLQMVEGERPDVMILDQAKLTYPWYYEQCRDRFPDVVLPGERYDGAHILNRHLIAGNIDKIPVCFMDFKEQSYQQSFRALPLGLVYQVIPKTQSRSLQEWGIRTNELYAQFKLRDRERAFPPTRFEFETKHLYAEPFFRLGYEFEQAGDFAKAEQYYKKTLEMNPYHYKVLKNLAVLYFYKMARQEEAVRLFRRYLEVNPYDAEANSIRQVIESYERGQGKLY